MAAHVNAFLEKLDKKLQEKNKFSDLLELAEKKTGLKRLYIVSGKNETKLSFQDGRFVLGVS